MKKKCSSLNYLCWNKTLLFVFKHAHLGSIINHKSQQRNGVTNGLVKNDVFLIHNHSNNNSKDISQSSQYLNNTVLEIQLSMAL